MAQYAASVLPHHDLVAQNDLGGTSLKGAHDGGWGTSSSQFA